MQAAIPGQDLERKTRRGRKTKKLENQGGDVLPLGAAIRAWREHLGISVTDLAVKVGLGKNGRGHISKVELGIIRDPGEALLAAIAVALGVGSIDLRAGRGPETLIEPVLSAPRQQQVKLSESPAAAEEPSAAILQRYETILQQLQQDNVELARRAGFWEGRAHELHLQLQAARAIAQELQAQLQNERAKLSPNQATRDTRVEQFPPVAHHATVDQSLSDSVTAETTFSNQIAQRGDGPLTTDARLIEASELGRNQAPVDENIAHEVSAMATDRPNMSLSQLQSIIDNHIDSIRRDAKSRRNDITQLAEDISYNPEIIPVIHHNNSPWYTLYANLSLNFLSRYEHASVTSGSISVLKYGLSEISTPPFVNTYRAARIAPPMERTLANAILAYRVGQWTMQHPSTETADAPTIRIICPRKAVDDLISKRQMPKNDWLTFLGAPLPTWHHCSQILFNTINRIDNGTFIIGLLEYSQENLCSNIYWTLKDRSMLLVEMWEEDASGNEIELDIEIHDTNIIDDFADYFAVLWQSDLVETNVDNVKQIIEDKHELLRNIIAENRDYA